MSFIQKIIEQKKLRKEKDFKRDCCPFMLNLENFIGQAQDWIDLFSMDKNDVDESAIDDFMFQVEKISTYYEYFLDALKSYEHTLRYSHYKNRIAEAEPKVEYMHEMKKQYRTKFENIYKNFRRVAKKCDDNIPLNSILKKMREAFDFDSSKYHKPEQYTIIH